MNEPSVPPSARRLFEAHGRSFQRNRYVYPVLSRRSGGISIGVNLNRDKCCNFRCVYCQVDRTELPDTEPVDVAVLTGELERMIEFVRSGRIYQETKFRDTPEPFRRLNDVALSGDGEPTTCKSFGQALAACAEVLRRSDLPDVKLVLITNASTFHRPQIRRALELLDAANGEIWAKLDAGTEDCFRQIARTSVPFRQILENLREAARARPIVIQSLFFRTHGQPPSPQEQAAYCDRLDEILAAGGQIKLVQIHTIARPPAEPHVTALSNAELDALANQVRRRPGLPTKRGRS